MYTFFFYLKTRIKHTDATNTTTGEKRHSPSNKSYLGRNTNTKALQSSCDHNAFAMQSQCDRTVIAMRLYGELQPIDFPLFTKHLYFIGLLWHNKEQDNHAMAQKNMSLNIITPQKKYTRRESNPNLKNRNLPFYPLNYGCLSGAKVQKSF